jgi:hypothetical protein
MGYQQQPGMTGSISAGGAYDDLDTTNSNVYPILAAEDAAAAALSAAAALASQNAAAASATSAANSASSASTSATNAATSATSASNSATSATNSATSASSSASAAATSATNASNSASSAATSATNASNSAATATTQAGIATTQATNASASATSAASSASAANTSATNAASSASAAATSETNAANSASSASTSATNAASSASSASTSATSASNSASAASTSASNASSSASAAASSASSAATSATNAAAAQTAAEAARDQTLAAYDNFDDRYLGAKTSDPTVDNDGNPLVAGALYFNSTLGYMKVYTGSVWVDAYAAGTSFLAKASNLSDLPSVSTARTNLGLGTAATTNSTAYATAAQGATADTAIQTLTSVDGSVVISPTGTTRDLSVGTAANTATLIASVRNETGSTLTKGTIVTPTGAASGNKMLVQKALANSDATSAQTYGMIQADIPNNQNGFVVITGEVTNLNTAGLTEGGILYLSPTVAGGYTQTKPYAPNHLVYVGIVTRVHATQGIIQTRIQNGYELDEIHDVSAQTPSANDFLVRNGSNLWVNLAPAAARTAMDVDQAGTAVALAIALG